MLESSPSCRASSLRPQQYVDPFVAMPQLCSQPAATAVLIGPADPAPVELRLLPSIGGLVGTVLAPDGSVVPEATVTASDARGDIVGSTRSDVDGRYRLADLPPGRYMVVATTYAPAAVQVEVPAGDAARVDLRLGTLTRAES